MAGWSIPPTRWSFFSYAKVIEVNGEKFQPCWVAGRLGNEHVVFDHQTKGIEVATLW
jgi:hypothetical protein